MSYREIIVVNPNILFGKPCIAGARIAVTDVPGWLASDMSIEQILEDYPQLRKEQLLACLAFAADKERTIQISV